MLLEGERTARQARDAGQRPHAVQPQLEERLTEVERELGDGPVPRPRTWGGYLVVPDAWEFWQHRASRLHDRFRYEREPSGGWRLDRLFP